jgi:hypothetical protein
MSADGAYGRGVYFFRVNVHVPAGVGGRARFFQDQAHRAG